MTIHTETAIALDRAARLTPEIDHRQTSGRPRRLQRKSTTAPALADGVALAMRTAVELPGLKAIKPKGRSMADAFVTENDVVLVQPADDIEDGELVAVRRDKAGPIVLRRISFEGDHAILRAEDRRRHPTVLPRGRLEVCGRVVAIVRSGTAAPM